MSDVVDIEDLMSRVGGDEELLAELVALFRDDAQAQLEAIRHAVTDQDAASVFQFAHALKGSASNFCCPAFVEQTRVLEEQARGGELTNAEQMLKGIEQGLSEVLAALEPYALTVG